MQQNKPFDSLRYAAHNRYYLHSQHPTHFLIHESILSNNKNRSFSFVKLFSNGP